MGDEDIAGRYQLMERLGSGGMGEVWRGYDAVLDREVAVKLITRGLRDQEIDEFERRFRREARVTARIGHPGVPQVYDAVLDRPYDRVYLVMEYVPGTSLRAFIDADAPLPASIAAAIGAQLAAVLSYAHAIPAVHRDIKPDNILVTPGGTVKLLDFGIAAVLRTDTTRLTSTGSLIGTSRYMSPEQITGGQISPRSDLYALGCVLYELVAGRPVFDGSNYQLMQQHVHEPPTPLEAPDALSRLVTELLAKNPDERPPDATAVYERLLSLLPAPGAAGAPDGWRRGRLPDPTLPYRRPNAPLPRPSVPLPDPVAASIPVNEARDVLRAAVAESDGLLRQERFVQAAEVLHAALDRASTALGARTQSVLRVRMQRASALLLGGDARHALAEYEALASAFGDIEGPNSEDSLDCLRQAAYCRAVLGETSLALRQFRHMLERVRATGSDVSETALDLRHSIGLLLLAESRTADAAIELAALHADLIVLYGPDHEESVEIADLLARLHLTDQ